MSEKDRQWKQTVQSLQVVTLAPVNASNRYDYYANRQSVYVVDSNVNDCMIAYPCKMVDRASESVRPVVYPYFAWKVESY